MHEIWPEAPLYTSFVDWGNLGNQGNRFKHWDIRTSPIADNWLVRKFHSPLRFLAPLIWKSFSAKGGSASGGDLSGYDVVISSSGWFMCRGVVLHSSLRAKRSNLGISGIAASSLDKLGTPRNDIQNGPLHICYIHHPPRNLYGYPTGSDLQKYWLVRAYATVVNFFLRHYDFQTAQNVDYFIANSEETRRRVGKFYRREATVIYPPIEILQGVALQKGPQGHPLRKREYFLSVGRLTYSKRVDLAIEACNRLKLPLKVVGTGKEEGYLRKLASQGDLPSRSKHIEFLGSVTDEELSRLYAGARALIFCALEEDFGMVPVEAMAHGTPVIALAQGGVVESVVDGKTGVLFREPTVASLVNALGRFGKLGKLGGLGRLGENCKKQAEKFGKERFKREMREFVRNTMRI